MAATLKKSKVTRELAKLDLDDLSERQRVALAHRILGGVVKAAPGSTLTDELRAELIRRVEHAKAHPEELLQWDDVYQATMKRLGK